MPVTAGPPRGGNVTGREGLPGSFDLR